jgi:DNA-binding NtrC family response regulator
MRAGTILVVDDEQLIRWSLTSRLPRGSFGRITTISNASAALTAAVALPPNGVDLEQLENGRWSFRR